MLSFFAGVTSNNQLQARVAMQAHFDKYFPLIKPDQILPSQKSKYVAKLPLQQHWIYCTIYQPLLLHNLRARGCDGARWSGHIAKEKKGRV
jgi:hypothetical protein